MSNGNVLFTQQDMVTVFAPPGQPGVRVGTVTGQINGTITIVSTFDTTVPPPNFKASGTALIVDTDGDQIFLNVAFTGHFIPPSALVQVGGSFTAVYTVTSGTGKYASITGQAFNGVGVAVNPTQNPTPGAAFSQFTGSLKLNKPK